MNDVVDHTCSALLYPDCRKLARLLLFWDRNLSSRWLISDEPHYGRTLFASLSPFAPETAGAENRFYFFSLLIFFAPAPVCVFLCLGTFLS